MYTSFFICHGFPEMRKAAFVAEAVHGLVCAATIAANLDSHGRANIDSYRHLSCIGCIFHRIASYRPAVI